MTKTFTPIKTLNNFEFPKKDGFLSYYKKAILAIQVKNKVMNIRFETKRNGGDEEVIIDNPEEKLLEDLGIFINYEPLIKDYKEKRDIEEEVDKKTLEVQKKEEYNNSWMFSFIKKNKEEADKLGISLLPSKTLQQLTAIKGSLGFLKVVMVYGRETASISREEGNSFTYYSKYRNSHRFSIVKNLFKSFITKIENEINEIKREDKNKGVII